MKANKWSVVLAWFGLIVCFAAACVVMALRIDWHLDSDMSGELLLAKIMATDGVLISPDWYYSTELRVLCTQLIFAPLFCIFQSWHTVRVVGSILWYVALMASAYYFCRQAKLKRAFPFMGILLMLPLSEPYVANILQGIHYIPVIVASFLTLGMILQFMNAQKKSARIALLCGVGALSAFSGLGGFRSLLVFNLPVALAGLFIYVKQRTAEPKDARGARLMAGSLASLLCAGAGCLFNMLVLAKRYSYNTYDSLSFTAFSWDNVVRTAQNWMQLMGYREGKVFSATLLFNLAALCLIVLTVVCLARCLKRNAPPALPLEHKTFAAFYGVATLLFVALYAVTDMFYHPTYMIPVAVFAIPLIVSLLENTALNARLKSMLAGGLAVLFLVCGALTWTDYCANDETEELRELTAEMVDMGYEYGYSSFWDGGNMITELSDGKIDMYVGLSKDVEDIDWTYKWMQHKSHDTERPDGPLFVLFKGNEMGLFVLSERLDPSNIVYYSDRYTVFGYDSYDEMKESLAEAEAYSE